MKYLLIGKEPMIDADFPLFWMIPTHTWRENPDKAGGMSRNHVR
jgi:hypothetical protein